MSSDQHLRQIIEPVVADLGLVLFDLDHGASLLKVTVDRPGRSGEPDRQDSVDIDEIAAVTRAVSRVLDETDPIPGHFTLEVSSPGLERTLRTPDHYRWAVGRDVAVKLVAGADVDGERRWRGRVTGADDHEVEIAPDDDPEARRRFPYDDIEKARTVFEWGPKAKPGKSSTQKPRQKRKAS